jgi:hypothetical protein
MNTPDPIEAPVAPQSPEAPLDPEAEKLRGIFSELTTKSSALRNVAGCVLTDVVSDWVVSEYTAAVRELLHTQPDQGERWKMLRRIGNDMATYRRGDHRGAWLVLQWAKFDEAVRQAVEEKERRDNPAMGCITQATLEKIEQEIGLLPPRRRPNPQPNPGESGL